MFWVKSSSNEVVGFDYLKDSRAFMETHYSYYRVDSKEARSTMIDGILAMSAMYDRFPMIRATFNAGWTIGDIWNLYVRMQHDLCIQGVCDPLQTAFDNR